METLHQFLNDSEVNI